MLKDYVQPTDSSESSETEFIEKHWTAIWQRTADDRTGGDAVMDKMETRILLPYLQSLPKEARVLDGGCGLGDWTMALLNRGYQVTGIDLSQQTIEKLKEYFPMADFQSMDIRHMTFADDSFDLYFSWGVFEHFENGMQECLAEAMRVLKPGGRLIISVPFDNLRHSIRNVLMPIRNQPQPQKLRFYQWRFTQQELSLQMTLAGFAVEKILPIHKRQGVQRMLFHDFGLAARGRVSRKLTPLLEPLLPGKAVAHMILAVAQKPE
ncbi:MAG: class I SAM-dependent methyltransferase [Magnetococcales bacterium]|nr:class I SAM-dependent methyltransferase [Magnetococcales bacterium]